MGNYCIKTDVRKNLPNKIKGMEEKPNLISSEEIVIVNNISEENQIVTYENQFFAIGNYIGTFNKYKHKMYLLDLKIFGNKVINLCIELSNILMERNDIEDIQKEFMDLKNNFIIIFYEKYFISNLKREFTDDDLQYHQFQVQKIIDYFRELDMDSFSIDPANGKFNCSLLWEWRSTLKESKFHLERVSEQIDRMQQRPSGLLSFFSKKPKLEPLPDIPACLRLSDSSRTQALLC